MLKWTDPKNEKKTKRKLAPNWMFLVESILGLGLFIIAATTSVPIMALFGVLLFTLSTGAFISRVKDYKKLEAKLKLK